VTGHEQGLLSRTAGDLGVALTPSQQERLLAYLDELCLWNRRINLTGLRSRDRMVVELLADSLVPAPHLPQSSRLLDVGSGAGLPGIPLKIARPDLSVDLLEPSAKRHHFLKQAVRLLRMEGIRALRGRIEDPAPLLLPVYDVVAARAVWGLREAVEACAPFVAGGGLLVGFAGGNAETELAGALPPAAAADLELEQSIAYRLPGTGGERRTVFFRKGATP
jgi:16S rRNA (guanine527-N7)-methyltransferase